MRRRTALPALFCLFALGCLAPAPAQALTQACEEAFTASGANATAQHKAGLYTACLETGQPSQLERALAHFNRGNMLRQLDRREQALADYGQAIALDKPDLHEAYNNRGALLVELGRYAEAIPDFDKAIALRPDEPFAHCNRGFAFARTGKPERALKDFDQALRLDPAYAYAWFGRGQAHEARGQYRPAAQDYIRAVALAQAYAPAANALAWLLATCPDESLWDGSSSLALARKAVELERSHRHLDTLAAAQARQGQFAAAAASEEEALRLLAAEEKDARAEYGKRLALYTAGKPYAEPARKP